MYRDCVCLKMRLVSRKKNLYMHQFVHRVKLTALSRRLLYLKLTLGRSLRTSVFFFSVFLFLFANKFFFSLLFLFFFFKLNFLLAPIRQELRVNIFPKQYNLNTLAKSSNFCHFPQIPQYHSLICGHRQAQISVNHITDKCSAIQDTVSRRHR